MNGAAVASWGKTSSDATTPNPPAAQPIHGGSAGSRVEGEEHQGRHRGHQVDVRCPGRPSPRCPPPTPKASGAPRPARARPTPRDTAMTTRASQIVDCGSPSLSTETTVRVIPSDGRDVRQPALPAWLGEAPHERPHLPSVWVTREGGVAGAGRKSVPGYRWPAPGRHPGPFPPGRRSSDAAGMTTLARRPAADPGRTVPDGAQRDHPGPHRRSPSTVGLVGVAADDPRLLVAAYAVYWVGDIADGWAARRLGQETRAGAVLDIVSDRAARPCCASVWSPTAVRGAARGGRSCCPSWCSTRCCPCRSCAGRCSAPTTSTPSTTRSGR